MPARGAIGAMAAVLATLGLLAAAPAAAGHAQPSGYFGAYPCGVACVVPGESPCGDTLIPYTHDDVLIIALGGPVDLRVDPTGDRDVVLCRLASDGSMTEAGTASNIVGENCDNDIGPNHPVPVGCEERLTFPGHEGERFVIRAFNVADPIPAPYWLHGAEFGATTT